MTTVETPFTACFSANSGRLTLDQLPLGTRCRVVAVDETSESLLRLMEMGLIPGAEIVLERSAPFRTPLSVRLPGCTLAIRRDDAHRVMVTLLDPSTDEAAH